MKRFTLVADDRIHGSAMFGDRVPGRATPADAAPPYRYTLGRAWDDSGPFVTFVMLNPSTADADADDPTIRRCTRFARDNGHGSLVVVNLFALRANDPARLLSDPDPVGPRNDNAIDLAARSCDALVVAWGALPPRLRPRAAIVAMRLLSIRATINKPVYALGVTADGSPRHPLYLRADAHVQPWESR